MAHHIRTESPKRTRRVEFGDFQTPPHLADEICKLLSGLIVPRTVIEPTCGCGNLLIAALNRFSSIDRAIGLEIDEEYVRVARERTSDSASRCRVSIEQADFFSTDWSRWLHDTVEPILVIGNPPWVSNSQLGAMGGRNLPHKSRQKDLRGLEAVTGKSNFDISEWMIRRLVEQLSTKRAVLAMLCKTSVARRILKANWAEEAPISSAAIHAIDATQDFKASVGACLLVCQFDGQRGETACPVYPSLAADRPRQTIGFCDGRLIADLSAYHQHRQYLGGSHRSWRSGIKHDCTRVMELKREDGLFRNGLGTRWELEEEYLYPMLKSSQLAGGKACPDRWMLVTQQSVGEHTDAISRKAPRTWHYLREHSRLLEKRGSSIYKGRPPYSIFGVGAYSFSPWKVAISNMYKKLEFLPIGSFGGKPIVLDDTACFHPCGSHQEAQELSRMLNGPIAQSFLSSLVFWDAKRPVTVELLELLDLDKLRAEPR